MSIEKAPFSPSTNASEPITVTGSEYVPTTLLNDTEKREMLDRAKKLTVPLAVRASALAGIKDNIAEIKDLRQKARSTFKKGAKQTFISRATAIDRQSYELFKQAWGYDTMMQHDSSQSALDVAEGLNEDYRKYQSALKEAREKQLEEWLRANDIIAESDDVVETPVEEADGLGDMTDGLSGTPGDSDDELDKERDRIVDTQNVSYDEAGRMLGLKK